MKLVAFVLLFHSSLVFAHGEDQLGPHQGFVRMPGAFHTEVVPVGKTNFKVFLLDIEWKNPSLANSKLNMKLQSKSGVSTEANCQPQKNHYLCRFEKSLKIEKGSELKVMAEREGQKGMEVSYPLPLKLQKNVPMEDMGHH